MKAILMIIFKILHETLADDTGFSSKRLTTLVSFLVMVIMAFCDLFTRYKLNIAVFETFTGITLSYSGMSLYDKKNNISYKGDNDDK